MKTFKDIAHSHNHDYFAGLTGLRGAAALWVMLLHFYALTLEQPKVFQLGKFQLNFEPFFALGWVGVHIFFVLSGFLLSIPFIQWLAGEKSYPNLSRYYLKRLLRVFPAYYFQLIIVLLLSLVAGYREIPSLESFILHLFMLIRIEPWFVEPLEGVWWTLPTELSFYLILPLVAVLCRRLGIVVIVVLALLLTVAFRYGFYTLVANQGIGMIVAKTERFPGHISLFIIGMAAAYLFESYRAILQKAYVRHIMLLLGVLILWLMSAWIYDLTLSNQYYNGHIMFFIWNSLNALGIALLILSIALQHRLCQWLFANRVAVFLGAISYSVYLWHFPIMKFVKNYIVSTESAHGSIFLLSLPLVILVAFFSYQYIEAPFIALASNKKQLMEKK